MEATRWPFRHSASVVAGRTRGPSPSRATHSFVLLFPLPTQRYDVDGRPGQ